MRKDDKHSLMRLKIWRTGCYIFLLILSVGCLLPFYMLLINASRAHVDIQRSFSLIPGTFLVPNVMNVIQNETILIMRGMLNSVIVSTTTVVLSVYFSALTAYAIHAYDFKMKKAAFAFILLIMTIPTQVGALGFVKMMTALHLKDTFIPLIIPAIASPATFFFIKQYMESSLPLEIVEAARIDGSGEFYTFNRIIMPMLKPALAVQAIFGFVSSWNNYFTPSLILTKADNKTLPLWIAYLRSADFTKFDMGKVYMLMVMAILPVMVIYVILSKSIIKGVTSGSVKG